MRRVAIILFFCVFALPSSLFAAGQSGTYTVQIGSERYPVSTLRMKGDEYVSLRDLAQAFQAGIEVDTDTGSTILTYKGNNIFLSSGRSAVFVNSEMITLDKAVEEVRGDLYVPPQFVSEAIAKIYEHNLFWNKKERTFAATTSGMISANLNHRSLRNMTRLVFQFDRTVHCTFFQAPGRILLRTQSGPIFVFFDEVEVDDGAVKSVAFKGGQERGTFVINLDRDYKYFTQAIAKNPYRVIIDIHRKRPLDEEALAKRKKPSLAAPLERHEEEERGFTEPEFGTGSPHASIPPGKRLRKEFRTVVIDPGHGGEETGAIGPNGIMEKDVTLSVAKVLRSLIETNLGLRVILTRETDVSLSLDERTAVANNNKAALFISIHANSSRRKNARGAETFFLSSEASDVSRSESE